MLFQKGPNCQSCGMPLSRDEKGGGTNADGSLSVEYCSRCYQGGKYVEPSLTVNEMMGKVKGERQEMPRPASRQTTSPKIFPKSNPGK